MDGMSVGDSLLEHYSLEYLDNNSSKKYYTESDSFYSLSLMSNDNSEFDYYIFHLKTGDDEYIIGSVSGFKRLPIEECKKEKKDIIKTMKFLSIHNNLNGGDEYQWISKNNEDIYYVHDLRFDGGYMRIFCADTLRDGDSFNIDYSSNEFMDFLNNELYAEN